MAFLEPDRYFSRISRIDINRDVKALGFTHILLDIDNTILTRDTHEVPRDVALWLGRARDAGITFCLVSNNWHKGVYGLADRLELPIVAKAIKPLPPAFLMAMSKVGAKRKSTLVVGDQLATDVLGAHFLGMTAYMLAPLVEQDLPHTLLLRNFERMIMGDRQPEGVAVPAEGASACGAECAEEAALRFESAAPSPLRRAAEVAEAAQASSAVQGASAADEPATQGGR